MRSIELERIQRRQAVGVGRAVLAPFKTVGKSTRSIDAFAFTRLRELRALQPLDRRPLGGRAKRLRQLAKVLQDWPLSARPAQQMTRLRRRIACLRGLHKGLTRI